MSASNGNNVLDPDRPTRAAVVVAHPDDETLWSGGTILARPRWSWHVISLCRGRDPDRAPRFARALGLLRASGAIGDLDDGPEQRPLADADVESVMTSLLPVGPWDVVITHGPRGEYTRHRRHEETCRAVVRLWQRGAMACRSLLLFAYEDGDRAYLPRRIPSAPLQESLKDDVWQRKFTMITECYGFTPESWEARTSPRHEAFWFFEEPAAARAWVDDHGADA